jgi:hypothetical protein
MSLATAGDIIWLIFHRVSSDRKRRFSDIAVGSLTAVLIGAPWVLMTPLSDKLIAFFDPLIDNESGDCRRHYLADIPPGK